MEEGRTAKLALSPASHGNGCGASVLTSGNHAASVGQDAPQPGSMPSSGAPSALDQMMLDLTVPGFPADPAEWPTPAAHDDWAQDAGSAQTFAWPVPLPTGGFGNEYGFGSAQSPFAHRADAEQPEADAQPQRRSAPGRRGGAGRADSLSAKEKNREAQRRFRDRQRERLAALEAALAEMRAFRDRALAGERRLRAERAALSTQIAGLQAEISGLHEREVALAELAADIAALRAGGCEGREDALDEVALALGELQAGGTESHAEFCAAKLCLFVKPEDLSATDPALVLALAGRAPGADAAVASPSRLKLRLRVEGCERVYSLAQLMHLPPQVFVAMYDGYVTALLAMEDRGGPEAGQLACQLRALLCCFAAVHPQASMELQLRDGTGPGVRSDADNKQLLCMLAKELRLSLGQLQRMRQAAVTHTRQQAQLQFERAALLRGAAMPLGCRPDASCAHVAAALEAEARLRRNLDLDLFNACRLTAHFLTDVLTTQQFVQLLAASHPHPLNLVELVHCLDSSLPAPDA